MEFDDRCASEYQPMKSATFRAVILTAGLMVSGAAAADGAMVPYSPPASGVLMSGETNTGNAPQIIGTAAAGSAKITGNVATEAESTTAFLPEHALSTLGALALGIIGLLWVRRHTAEM
jgi:hypothetical protein